LETEKNPPGALKSISYPTLIIKTIFFSNPNLSPVDLPTKSPKKAPRGTNESGLAFVDFFSSSLVAGQLHLQGKPVT